MMKLFLIILLSSILTTHLKSQSLDNQIDSVIQVYMDSFRITGLSVSIVKDGKQFSSKGYGKTSVESGYSVNPNTCFYTASISKVFTATAIMQLVEQGKIDIHSKLITYLPEFIMKDKRYKDITIYHLLTHSSGLDWDHKIKESSGDSIGFLSSFSKKKLNFAPGQKFNGTTYSNAGYDILGCLVERVSGLTFDKYIQQFILDPLKMSASTYEYEGIADNVKAMPHTLSGGSREIERFNLYGIIKDETPVLKYPENPIVACEEYNLDGEHNPSGNLISSAADLSLWMNHLLGIYLDSTMSNNSVIKLETLLNMWSLKESIPGKKTSMGLCWWRYSDPEFGDYVFHVGREPGFCSTLMLFPEQGFGITILCNGMYVDEVVWNVLPFEIMKILEVKK